MTGPDPYLEANRRLWREWTEINVRSAFYDVESFRRGEASPAQPRGGVRLRDYEIEEVGEVAGKDLLHLQCHFGLDTLSWARLGARVTGIDFSPEAIEHAQRLAEDIGIEARFVCSTVDDLPWNLDGDFDVVYTSRGVLGWLPDLARWAHVVARYLRPGGVFYITEIHPFALVFDDEGVGPGEMRVRFPYWSRPEPVPAPVEGSYADRDAEVSTTVEYWWPHGLGEIVNAILDAGLQIEFLRELPFCEWELPFLVGHPDGTWRLPEGRQGEVPLFFSLRAVKP